MLPDLDPGRLDERDGDEDVVGAGPALARGLLLAVGTIVLVALSLVAMASLRDNDDPRPSQRAATTFRYVIPAGSGARVDRGEVLYDVFPHVLDARVGDRLVVVNDDDRTHLIGPFTVRSGETLDYVFREAGTYRGQCTLHGAAEEAIIIVR